jgi:predicted outer membrane repeat protein
LTKVVTQANIFIENDVILDGEGNLTLDANQSHSVLSVRSGVTAELRRVTVTGGLTYHGGGGIYNHGVLTLTNSTVSGNAAEFWPHSIYGGAISNHGVLTLTNSTVSGNTSYLNGGGIENWGVATLTNSTVSGNTARYGGGIYSQRGTLTLTNSTVSGNTAQHGGGIYSQGGTLTLTHSTVARNTTEFGRCCDMEVRGVVTLTNSLVNGHCGFDMISGGYNIESPGNTCGFDQTGDQPDVTAEQLNLQPLADNGGPTDTHALGKDSVAIDVIPADMCEVDEDQRGFPRDSMCDVGAFEVQPAPAEGCLRTGGAVSTGLCCQAVESFPNICAIGACGCAPDASHEVDVCICPTNTCFDGESCVAQ